VITNKSSTPALVNFKDERLYYPPPERWIDNEYALFEEPSTSNKVMDFADENITRQSKSQYAVCIKDSYC